MTEEEIKNLLLKGEEDTPQMKAVREAFANAIIL